MNGPRLDIPYFSQNSFLCNMGRPLLTLEASKKARVLRLSAFPRYFYAAIGLMSEHIHTRGRVVSAL